MNIGTALLESPKENYDHSLKLTGLFLLERNIKLLYQYGVRSLHLLLSEKEKSFFQNTVEKHIRKLKGLTISFVDLENKETPHFSIPTNLFMQAHHLKEFPSFFTTDKNVTKPAIDERQFTIASKEDVKRAQQLIVTYIVSNTGGPIAQKLNKRFSIPFSLQMVKLRVTPNFLTVINFIIGIASSWALFRAAAPELSPKAQYLMMALGGFLFQVSSVFDGVDGEVAKMSLKVSRFGGWFDTICDNTTLLLFLMSASYLYYISVGGIISLITMGLVFFSLTLLLGIMVHYLRKYSTSESLVAVDREFIARLPKSDFLVRFAQNMKYLIKKETFSLGLCLFCLAGWGEHIIPGTAFVLTTSALTVTVLFLKYKKNIPLQ